MATIILEMILVGSKIFQEERKRHFEKEAKKLIDKIVEVSDSDFYRKDQEAKGKAEREIYLNSKQLAIDYLKEAKQ